METTNLSVLEALNLAMENLDGITVSGYTNTSRLSKAEELIAKVYTYLKESVEKPEKAGDADDQT